jgi:hypothetical protein
MISSYQGLGFRMWIPCPRRDTARKEASTSARSPFKVEGKGFGDWRLGFRVKGLHFRGLWFRFRSFGLEV